ncbi:hypothetical protein DFJ74DRAFT_752126 [Hyaloraphidium curvatum]|nr:hypothetical protein DFJ74DRAFT_752126 [Hyaloraphidium curvatum]
MERNVDTRLPPPKRAAGRRASDPAGLGGVWAHDVAFVRALLPLAPEAARWDSGFSEGAAGAEEWAGREAGGTRPCGAGAGARSPVPRGGRVNGCGAALPRDLFAALAMPVPPRRASEPELASGRRSEARLAAAPPHTLSPAPHRLPHPSLRIDTITASVPTPSPSPDPSSSSFDPSYLGDSSPSSLDAADGDSPRPFGLRFASSSLPADLLALDLRFACLRMPRPSRARTGPGQIRPPERSRVRFASGAPAIIPTWSKLDYDRGLEPHEAARVLSEGARSLEPGQQGVGLLAGEAGGGLQVAHRLVNVPGCGCTVDASRMPDLRRYWAKGQTLCKDGRRPGRDGHGEAAEG